MRQERDAAKSRASADSGTAAISCDNCRRIVQPPPARVMLLVEGRMHTERRLCSACRVHVSDEFLRPAPWIGEPPRAKVTR